MLDEGDRDWWADHNGWDLKLVEESHELEYELVKEGPAVLGH